jgi:NTP pyrophosphatase (non-canonical NTP hydrolase)
MPSAHDWSTLSTILAELAQECHAKSDANGFWRYPEPIDCHPEDAPASEVLEIAAKIALIGGEAKELLEAWRLKEPFGPCPKDPENLTHFSEEMADVAIRLLDLAAHFRIDLGAAIRHKMAVNSKRAYRHGKRF